MNSMNRVLSTVVVMLLAALPFAGSIRAQKAGEKVYVVTHVDLTPNFAVEGAKALQLYVADSRKDPGMIRMELLQDNARTNHFTVVSVWENSKAFEAHEETEHSKRLREKIQPMLGSPFDERLHRMMN
jgi:quinol monooxygenase YgiN